MLQVRFETWNLLLDRDHGRGVWEFHRSQSSYCMDLGRKTFRYARLTPPDPANGKPVKVVLLLSPGAAGGEEIDKGEGVARVMADY